jgi:UDP-GlcNAc:undecaprenyl-phosphate GlcNAc-1-phosphate transferase
MRFYAVLFLVAAIVSTLLTPLVRRTALSLGAVSRPGGRNVNERAIPRMGGVAVALGTLSALAAAFIAHSSVVAAAVRGERLRIFGLVAGGIILCAVGAVDDARRVRPVQKLLLQIAVACLAFWCGYRIEAVKLPVLGELSMGAFALPVTVLWIVGITNAINLIDGLDGLAAGAAFFAGVTNFVVAYVSDSTLVAATMAAMLGAVVAFLFFNFNPARIFMGDSGSYFLGYVLGASSLAGAAQKTSTAVSLLVPIIALGLPIMDLLATVVRRFLEKRPIFSPDRGHIHHRLLDMGLTHRRAVLLLYGVCLLLTSAAIGVSLGRSWQIGVAILCASVVLVTVVRFAGYFEYVLLLRARHPKAWDRHARLLRAAMPEALAQLGDSRSTGDVIGALAWAARMAGIDSTELVPGDDGHARSLRPRAHEEEVVLELCLGPELAARSLVRFRWRPESGGLSPECETLLQVLIDVAAARFTRLGSEHAPRPAVEAPSSRPSLAATPAAAELR